MEYRKIVIDTEGSDKGAAMVIKGAAKALEKYDNLAVCLVGNGDTVREECEKLGILGERVEILHASDAITNYDSPAAALFEKPDSSMVVALEALSTRDDLCGIVSTGNTGALIAGAMKFLSTPERVRPALAVTLPSENGGDTCLVDTGATVDCTAQVLHHFARLGRDFVRALYKIDEPRVALLSNGAESTKGNKVVKEAHALLSEDEAINFVGNLEGTNALSGECDVLVCDGFVGNQVLKVTEGTAKRIIKDIIKYAKKTGEEKYMELVGYLMGLYDFNSMGGAVILGTTKPVMKAHGAANEASIMNTAGILLSLVENKNLF